MPRPSTTRLPSAQKEESGLMLLLPSSFNVVISSTGVPGYRTEGVMRRRWIEAVFTAGLAVAGEHCAAPSAADASACIELLADDGMPQWGMVHTSGSLVSVGAWSGTRRVPPCCCS